MTRLEKHEEGIMSSVTLSRAPEPAGKRASAASPGVRLLSSFSPSASPSPIPDVQPLNTFLGSGADSGAASYLDLRKL